LKSVGAGSGDCKRDAAAALARLRAAEREDEAVGEACASPEVHVQEEHPIPEREDEAVREACASPEVHVQEEHPIPEREDEAVREACASPEQACQPSCVAGAMLTVTPKMGPRSGLWWR